MDKKYYDGGRLLSMQDLRGRKPEIFICTSNRTAGKTTWFNSKIMRDFFDGKIRKFAILSRNDNELSADIATAFFKDIKGLYFNEYSMIGKPRRRGQFYELYVGKDIDFDSDEAYEGVSCGYQLSLNSHEKYKKVSHYFSDVDCIIMDEFMSGDNRYLSNEINAFRSIHETIARGQGKQTRYVPVYLVGNPVSILNPYYTALGVSKVLTKRTRFLRGNGWVLEQGYNESASKAMSESAFESAFEDDEYTEYAMKGEYLNDSDTFVSTMSGYGRYICTIKSKGKFYAVREFPQDGFMYVDMNADMTYPLKLAVDIHDHDTNYILLQRNMALIDNMRFLFEHGAFRFKNQSCKNAVIDILSY